jgi:hypothetical protein
MHTRATQAAPHRRLRPDRRRRRRHRHCSHRADSRGSTPPPPPLPSRRRRPTALSRPPRESRHSSRSGSTLPLGRLVRQPMPSPPQPLRRGAQHPPLRRRSRLALRRRGVGHAERALSAGRTAGRIPSAAAVGRRQPWPHQPSRHRRRHRHRLRRLHRLHRLRGLCGHHGPRRPHRHRHRHHCHHGHRRRLVHRRRRSGTQVDRRLLPPAQDRQQWWLRCLGHPRCHG